jgi:hypothetical protein
MAVKEIMWDRIQLAQEQKDSLFWGVFNQLSNYQLLRLTLSLELVYVSVRVSLTVSQQGSGNL